MIGDEVLKIVDARLRAWQLINIDRQVSLVFRLLKENYIEICARVIGTVVVPLGC